MVRTDNITHLRPRAHGRDVLIFRSDSIVDLSLSEISQGFTYTVVAIGCTVQFQALGDDDVNGSEAVEVSGGPVYLVARDGGYDVIDGQSKVSAVDRIDKVTEDQPTEETTTEPEAPEFDESAYVEGLAKCEHITQVDALERSSLAIVVDADMQTTIKVFADSRRNEIRIAKGNK